jgi:hypothetical protein
MPVLRTGKMCKQSSNVYILTLFDLASFLEVGNSDRILTFQ